MVKLLVNGEAMAVQPGQPVMALVTRDDLWVVANFKETQLTHITVGQPESLGVSEPIR